MPPRRRTGPRWVAVTVGAGGAAAVIGVVVALTLSSQSGGGPAGVRSSASASASAPGGASGANGASGTSGAGTASASSSLIAVTVCSDPAGGCTYAGASQIMEVQPKQIYLSADGSRYVDGLTWTGWGQPQASATGSLKVNDCTPSCAQGTFSPYPATVTLTALKPYGTGLEAYSAIVVRSPSASMTFSYAKDLVP
jgi:hypothetical protein